MEIEIREIEEKDYPALLPRWNEFGGHVNIENIARHYNRIKDDERYKTYVALAAGEVAGFIMSVKYYGIGIKGSYMVIVGISVKEEKRGMGIGTKLLNRMEEYAKDTGVFHIYMNSGFKRTAAHALYERCGYNKGSYGFGKTVNPE
jgi:GNAT superfamily N-acetyltransferase